MRFIVAFYLAALTIWILVRIVRLSLRGRVELFSVHTIFLVGFIIFQLTSSVMALTIGMYGDLGPTDLVVTPIVFSMFATVFLFIFEWAYLKNWNSLERLWRPGADWDGDASGWMLLAVLMIFVGFVMKIIIAFIPLVGILSSQAAAGVLAAAAGCAAWGWSRNFRSPGLAFFAIAIFVAASAIMLHRSFGRRPVLGVLLGFGWALYYGYWRAFPKKIMIRRLLVAGLIGSLLLTVYSATRKAQHQFERRGILDAVLALGDVSFEDLTSGYVSLLAGQQAGPLSMWAVESYGSVYPYDPFHQIKFLATMPIPRELWPGKPTSLGKEMVYHGYIRQKGGGNVYSVGPGIIGHAAHDFPWVTIPLYALALGWVLRFIDERTVSALHRPFVIIPCGAALGQVLALCRGETAVFAWEIGMAIIGAWIAMRVGGRLLSSVGYMWETDPVPPHDPFLEDEYDDQADEWEASTV
jgi:hypothetical protein